MAKLRLSMGSRMRLALGVVGLKMDSITSEPYELSPFVMVSHVHSGFCITMRSASSEAGYAASTGLYCRKCKQIHLSHADEELQTNAKFR